MFWNHHHHHHHVVPLAQISLTLSHNFSLSFIAYGRSSGLHPVSSHSCCMYVRAGRPAFAWPYAGVHRSTSLVSSSLLLQQCPACLVRLTCIVFVNRTVYLYKMDLALNNLQRLICHKNGTNKQTKIIRPDRRDIIFIITNCTLIGKVTGEVSR